MKIVTKTTLTLFAIASMFCSIGYSQAGPEILEGNRVQFKIRANQAKEVSVRGQWSKEPIAMTKGEGENALWSVLSETIPSGVWEYSFVVDGQSIIDPTNPTLKPQREPGKSILHIPGVPLSPWDFQDVPHGTVHHHNYLSKSLGKVRELSVYTPPGYETSGTATYPLLVLQHGSGDNQLTWVVHGKAHWILDSLIASGKAIPMVVLMIDGHPMGQVSRDKPQAREQSLEAFSKELFEDAMPIVESSYRVDPSRERRAIAGLSMGGWQSINIGLHHLEKFATVGSFSGAANKSSLDKVFADVEGTNAKLKLLWIACGKDDFLLGMNQELVGALKENNIKHEWYLTDGDHSWPVWRTYLADFLPKLFK